MLDNNMEILKLLIQYGAYLDFRTKSGKTALHNVAIIGKDLTVKVRNVFVDDTLLHGTNAV